MTRKEPFYPGIPFDQFHVVGFGGHVALHTFVFKMQSEGDTPFPPERQHSVEAHHERRRKTVAVDAADGFRQRNRGGGTYAIACPYPELQTVNEVVCLNPTGEEQHSPSY